MGAFIVIEGSDGSGKATQALELEERVHAAGYNVLKVAFPNYGSATSRFIERYLEGAYGPVNTIHPELASMLYAVDRFADAEKIRTHLRKPHAVVVADRYVASNLAHQGTKFTDSDERRQFYEQIVELEYDILGLPKPDLNVVLLVPAHIASDNTAGRQRLDEHEKDAEHLQRACRNYREITNLYSEWFTVIDCTTNDNSMRPIKDIGEDIWQTVLPILRDRAL